MVKQSDSWKAEERRTCATLKMLRSPLSGRNGGAGTNGDCYDPTTARSNLYVEIKHYATGRVPGGALFRDTRDKAKKEKRTPIVVMHEKGTRNRFAWIDFEFLCELLDAKDSVTNGA